ncbi:MAG: thioredoxin domain-containing protein [Epsilonproteobacteria bacterium]|nr:thioredoxin domain-containing protein [Campylobacterota bacterium]NPA63904.1 thioredoxin domain-containing protein [Campylobacterota bacterium]
MKRLLWIILALTVLFAKEHTNELIFEESPYLRQHAHNPVNWLPWGPKAFEKAKKEHKPIFLSIGYSTCHWCHVMERESFENEEIAKLINDNFIPIKVDKEERPDLDRYYQTVYEVMHQRSGGWPLTIIMTEDKKPFFSATYIPPEDGYGVKGLKTILPVLAKAYKEQRAYLQKRGEAVLKMVDERLNARYVPVQLDMGLAQKALQELKERYDPIYGGFSKKIKFPQPSTIELLLDIYLITKEKEALDMALMTLTKMAKGGIYDQIEGGFFRYTTDRKWQIPHFEKMLYTNAELIRVYTKAYTITKDPLYAKVVQETIDQIDRRFGAGGLYFSASDADSGEEEGGYFLFEYQKSYEYLKKAGIKDPKSQLAKLGITPDGTFDGQASNPTLIQAPDPKVVELLRRMRQERPYPFIDKKVIAAWNAMYIEAKLHAFVLQDRYKKEALASLDRLLQSLAHNGLHHQKYLDNPAKLDGMLEDYAYMIKALTKAYEVSLQPRYLTKAKELFDEARGALFDKGVWYFSRTDHNLSAPLDDSYYSSALGTLYHAMLDLAILLEDPKIYRFAKKSIDEKSALIFHSPASFPTATRAVFRLKIGDVMIKAPKESLQKVLVKIPFISYPYLHDKVSDTKGFMACTIDSCFASGADFEHIVDKIEERLRPKASIGWGDGKR